MIILTEEHNIFSVFYCFILCLLSLIVCNSLVLLLIPHVNLVLPYCSLEVTMASEPQSNPGKMMLEPSQHLITMFRLAP